MSGLLLAFLALAGCMGASDPCAGDPDPATLVVQNRAREDVEVSLAVDEGMRFEERIAVPAMERAERGPFDWPDGTYQLRADAGGRAITEPWRVGCGWGPMQVVWSDGELSAAQPVIDRKPVR